MDIKKATDDIKAAEAVADTLNDIGWYEYIKPELEEEKKKYQNVLVLMTLNPKIQDTLGRTKEEVAGCIYGINILSGAIERIIKRGISASKALQESVLSIKEENAK